MIQYLDITYQNFLMTGNVPITVQLNDAQTTLIVGKNGAGKSTLIDALNFVQFDSAFRKINKPQLVNSINKKNCLVTLNMVCNGDKVKIVRGINPRIAEVHVNGELLKQTASPADYQKHLINNILKMDERTFKQIIVLGSNSYTPFMKLSIGDRRMVIEDTLDIKVIGLMNLVTKARLKTLKPKLQTLLADLRLSESKLESERNHLIELVKSKSEDLRGFEVSIQENRQYIATEEAKHSELIKQHTALNDKYQSAPDVQAMVRKLENLRHTVLSNIATAKKERQFYIDNPECPTCKQDFDPTVKAETIQTNEALLKQYDEGLLQMEARISTLRKQASERDAILSEINLLSGSMSRVDMNISSTKRQCDNLQKQIDEISNRSSNLEAERACLIETLEADVMSVKHKTTVCGKDVQLHTDMVDLLKDSGIKSTIIKRYIPIINSLLAKYFEVMDFDVSFQFDEAFNEVIKSRHRDKFTYASFSEGQAMRVDLAILFTFRELTRMRNSVASNLLILDEIGSSSLDAAGMEACMKIIKAETGNNVVVISHDDRIQDYFDVVQRVTVSDNFTQMEEVQIR